MSQTNKQKQKEQKQINRRKRFTTHKNRNPKSFFNMSNKDNVVNAVDFYNDLIQQENQKQSKENSFKKFFRRLSGK